MVIIPIVLVAVAGVVPSLCDNQRKYLPRHREYPDYKYYPEPQIFPLKKSSKTLIARANSREHSSASPPDPSPQKLPISKKVGLETTNFKEYYNNDMATSFANQETSEINTTSPTQGFRPPSQPILPPLRVSESLASKRQHVDARPPIYLKLANPVSSTFGPRIFPIASSASASLKPQTLVQPGSSFEVNGSPVEPTTQAQQQAIFKNARIEWESMSCTNFTLFDEQLDQFCRKTPPSDYHRKLFTESSTPPVYQSFYQEHHEVGLCRLQDFVPELVLGEGEHMTFFKAYHLPTRRNYIIKYFSSEAIKGREKVLENEEKFLRALDHPNILSSYCSMKASDGGRLEVVEFISGKTLRKTIQEAPAPFERARLAYWFLQLLDVLRYIHSKGIVHRDIRPANIIITDQNHVKLVGFSLAQFRPEEGLNLRAGSPTYFSPEMMLGQRHGIGADLFALGIVLATTANLQYPYHIQNLEELELASLTVQHLGDIVDPVNDPMIDKVVRRLIQYNPSDRLRSIYKHPPGRDELQFNPDFLMLPFFTNVLASNNFTKDGQINTVNTELEASSTTPLYQETRLEPWDAGWSNSEEEEEEF